MLNLAETYAPLAASTGLLPAADVEAWLADQRRSAEDGTFFAACNYYAYVAIGAVVRRRFRFRNGQRLLSKDFRNSQLRLSLLCGLGR